MITLDTSAIYAIVTRTDPNHARVLTVINDEAGPRIYPVAALGELSYLLEHRLSPRVLDAVLARFESGGFLLDCGEADMPRIRQLIHQYADFPLGFVDAAVIACAERHGGRVLTTDFRHFGAVAREGTISLPLLEERR